VLALVKVLATKPPTSVDRAEQAWRELLAHPRLRNPQRRARMLRWIAAARSGVAFREDSHLHLTRPLPILRAALCRLAPVCATRQC
jgi:hypothetical protein